MLPSHYDKFPCVAVCGQDGGCSRGWDLVAQRIADQIRPGLKARSRWVVAVECYPGVHHDELTLALQTRLRPDHWVPAQDAFQSEVEIDNIIAPYLGADDPIFGFLTPLSLDAFLDPHKQAALARRVDEFVGLVVVYGTGALLCCTPDTVVYADMPRWEGQLRQRRNEVSNLGAHNSHLKASLQYKRSFFVDWRVCDRLKKATLDRWDFFLDTTVAGDPKLVTGEALRAGLDQATQRPFRLVPFFDPAPWGGQWMKDVCGLDRAAANFGWCFDCVPEENSLVLRFGDTTVELPAQDLVYACPQQLLGESVYGLFGPEFPIRFDLLDTMGGSNLSLQVHPPIDYAQEQFGLHYTQDESYYILDAGDSASVYLGLVPPADSGTLFAALKDAQAGGTPFPADHYVGRWPAHRHDHFLIPAGTIHCSGAETMVLEISATPYIFTFKLWDWGRLGLDGLPRPINLRHGKNSLRTERDVDWARTHLVNQIELLGTGDGWREERTGLHALEFIESRRHWFTQTVLHDTRGTVNVLNLVQGREAIVESPTGAFAPFVVHYAETFIVPAAVGPYTIRPHGDALGQECATLKAFVRSGLSPLAP